MKLRHLNPFRRKKRRQPPPAPESQASVQKVDPWQVRETLPKSQDMIDAWLDDLRAVQPVPVSRAGVVADGVAMDSLDDIDGYMEPETGGPIQPTTPAYRTPSIPGNAQPNLPSTVVDFFLRQTFIGHQLAGMLSQNWLIGKCCWLPARDAVRKGFDFVNADDDDRKEVVRLLKSYDRRYQLKRNLTDFVGYGKAFGIRVAIFQVESDQDDYYEHPFNPDTVKPGSYRGLSQVDPYWCVPELDGIDLSDPSSQHFYEPTWWVIGGKRYHRSHLAIYREGDVPDILKPCYLYGGIPVPQKVLQRVYASERTANEAPELAMSKRLIAFQTNMDEVLAGGPNTTEKLSFWSQFMNNFGIMLHGTDEAILQHDTSLNDFDAVTMTQYQLVASAANVPATKLLGTSPKGFGASGEYEIESYHEELESIQEDQLTDLVNRHHLLVMLSDIAPKMQRSDSEWRIPSIEIVWLPLDTPTTKETAEINYIKSQTAINYINAGALDGVDVRDNLIDDPDSGFAGIPGMYRPGEPSDPDSDEIEGPLTPVSAGGQYGA